MPTKNSSALLSVIASCLIPLFIVTGVFAEEIYKITDQNGNISYTTDPPDAQQESTVINTLPEPSEQEIAEARERQQSIENNLRESQEAIREKNEKSEQSNSGSSTIIVQPSPAIFVNPYYYRDRPHHPHRPPTNKPGHRPPAHIQPLPSN